MKFKHFRTVSGYREDICERWAGLQKTTENSLYADVFPGLSKTWKYTYLNANDDFGDFYALLISSVKKGCGGSRLIVKAFEIRCGRWCIARKLGQKKATA